ncbi:MAG: LUD domain-containing protein [Dehalococcoidia bacterium]|jgi:L-lactate dehydrogenase complex protein LldG|nr:LUD domain-containing protein [Dehalococcoidia bacterium]
MDTMLDRFRSHGDESQSVVHELSSWGDVAALALELASDGRVVITPSLAAEAPQLVVSLGERSLVPSFDEPVAEVADAAVGIVRGDLAVVETGSVLVSADTLADRAVSMLSRTVLQVVDRDRFVGRLDDVAQWLARRAGTPAYATLVTGPSRTADIERSLTIGVQGPAEVHVVALG